MSLINKDYPVNEFDNSLEAIIEARTYQEKYGKLNGDKLIITFFKEVIDKLLEENQIATYLVIPGENVLTIYKFLDKDIYLIHGIVGGPACGIQLETLIGLGISKILFCGGGGVLDKNIKVGELLLVNGAIRDEGTSYQYVPASRIIKSNKEVLNVMEKFLLEKEVPFLKGLVWTTDALYRETKSRILTRKNEGAKIVEMEQAGLIAISQFRKVKYGAIIYGGDDVSQSTWDNRNWADKKGVRYSLVELLKEMIELI